MALKLRKDIKKSSYYVWFLGAKESKGLRGTDFILPVIKHLEEREKDIEPFKVTLQVSHKGLKIIQNVIGAKGNKNKSETIKHFIPHNTITCVYQHEDVIACILLLFNPVTKCPLHVHAYRCDSLETATLLKQQLQTLIERPENQKKFAEIEVRLGRTQSVSTTPVPAANGADVGKEKNFRSGSSKGKVESSLGSSDTGTSTRESESSEERFAVDAAPRVTTLYDSVAAELRAKLAKNSQPILLPPRDYDTVHRQKGNLTGIELRRCLNANIVGQNVKARRLESSGGSSGIGSDHPPSPDSPDSPDTRFNTLDNQSTSDEDWNGDPAESTLYMLHTGPPLSESSKKPQPRSMAKYLDKPKYQQKSAQIPDDSYHRDTKPVKYFDDDGFDEHFRFRSNQPVPKTRQKYPAEIRTPSPSTNSSPRERFYDAKEKFLSMEKRPIHELPISPNIAKDKPFLKRHESMAYPKPAPRHLDERFDRFGKSHQRRSMYNLTEDEDNHRKHSADIAKELKRRSYDYSKSNLELDQVGEMVKFGGTRGMAGYRHSYAESKGAGGGSRKGSGANNYEMGLCRTNSVSNNGRVGIASVHPY